MTKSSPNKGCWSLEKNFNSLICHWWAYFKQNSKQKCESIEIQTATIRVSKKRYSLSWKMKTINCAFIFCCCFFNVAFPTSINSPLRFTFIILLIGQRPQTQIKARLGLWNVDLQQSWKWIWIRNMIECTKRAPKIPTKATNEPKMNAIRLNYQCRDTSLSYQSQNR